MGGGERARELKLDQLDICQRVPCPAIAPRILSEATVDFALLHQKSQDRAGGLHSNSVQGYTEKYCGYVQVYTDASKNPAKSCGGSSSNSGLYGRN